MKFLESTPVRKVRKRSPALCGADFEAEANRKEGVKIHCLFIIIAIFFILSLWRMGIEDLADIIMLILAVVMLAINLGVLLK